MTLNLLTSLLALITASDSTSASVVNFCNGCSDSTFCHRSGYAVKNYVLISMKTFEECGLECSCDESCSMFSFDGDPETHHGVRHYRL